MQVDGVTIFIATYQRAKTLPRLYASLQAQTSKAFEWIVIDDGSTDGTEALVRGWAEKERTFPIRYVRQPHGGKHRAHNRAVSMAQFEPFFIVDSDDYLAVDAIENVQAWFEEIATDATFVGVSGLKAHFDGRVIGGDGGGQIVDAMNIEREAKDLLWDHSEVYKTSVLRQFPFPEFPGEDFIGEGVVGNAIALAGYKIRWHPVITYYCEYRQDGLTCNAHARDRRNPRGVLANIRINRKYRPRQECGWQLFVWKCRHPSMGHVLKEDEQADIHDCIEGLRKELHEWLDTNVVRKLAIYGFGEYGHCVLSLRDVLGIDVFYAMDCNSDGKEQNDVPVYFPGKEPSKADGVLVTMAQYDAGLDAWLKERYSAVVWLMNLIRKGHLYVQRVGTGAGL